MKTKFLLPFVVVLLFGSSCDDSNDSNDTISEDPLAGVWHLKNVSGGIQGIDLDYDQGDVSWNFMMDESTLEVESNILTDGPKSINQGLLKGIYAVEFDEQQSIRTLVILGAKFRVLEIDEKSTLVIDDGVAADGFVRTFER
ncbi:hypothetical protein FEE95_14895 [Maribacter algarum]|uniref:Lipocalin-like domain-containing protein n=1 Tax=Maribacter algarum (ex Zhang et al. 2020) TaxID=2578118 RepID=A0A5S3PN80_9FLAO|nr:hypothetical protein [Maribacter algarum]TMM55932.1 hypothetical protein FEE95_14895 [Maribacter algarum]